MAKTTTTKAANTPRQSAPPRKGPRATERHISALGRRLKKLRQDAKMSQEGIGALGFISTPGWIKLENSQRLPSDALITKIVACFIKEGSVKGTDKTTLREELLTLKYCEHRSDFVRGLAKKRLETLDGQ